MPSTVNDLLAAVGLEPSGCVPWGTPVPETATGVYIVSTGSDAASADAVHAEAPLSTAALDELISVCPSITLDGKAGPTREQLETRIATYWLRDECVLYVGLAGQPLRTRVRQYYKTPLGAPKPHKGGWWLKTLAVLDDVYVHYARAANFKDAEEEMLRAFAANISDASRAALPEGEPLMPFANLRDGDWQRRNHRIAGATQGATDRRAPNSVTTRPGGSVREIGVRGSSGLPDHRSQNLTSKDIEVGQVRIPRGATKTMLPRERTDITVVLRGEDIGTCRWDPRYGPPERSGVIRVGKAAAMRLLEPGDLLSLSVASDERVALVTLPSRTGKREAE